MPLLYGSYTQISNKRVLISPLNWGLGHATRIIPVLAKLIENNCEVYVLADKHLCNLLRSEFQTTANFIEHESLTLSYSKHLNLVLKILLQLPKIILASRNERKLINSLAKKLNLDVVISDNRFGLRSKHCHSIYITHQIAIKMPGFFQKLEPLSYRLHKRLIETFNECWIPDYAGENNLSGNLSHKYPLPRNTSFIGILSRFMLNYSTPTLQKYENYQLLVIISGLEPHRTLLEEIIELQALELKIKTLIIKGCLNSNENNLIRKNTFIHNISHVSSAEMKLLINATPLIISRAGYSTIMDLTVLRKKALLIPTPQQSEQEYLAIYLQKNSNFIFAKQKGFSLKEELKKLH